jgi:hypothetical protein
LVLLLPAILGYQGIPFEKQVVSICRLCPAGALEAGLPYSVQSLMAGTGWLMSGLKTGILIAWCFWPPRCSSYRPWCRMLLSAGGPARALQPLQPVSSPVSIPKNAWSATSAAAAVPWA